MLQLSLRERITLARIHQGRKRGHPTVGQRIAGQRNEWPDKFGHITGPTGFSELQAGSIQACWWRNHGAGRHDFASPQHYWVSVRTCGASLHFPAVVDDFGTLVAVDAQ